jgi:mevalonate kinase
MTTIKIKTKSDIPDYVLEESLEKALRGVRHARQTKRELYDPAMNAVYNQAEKSYERIINSMLKKIEETMNEAVEETS